jgi:hypothetical protein
MSENMPNDQTIREISQDNRKRNVFDPDIKFMKLRLKHD